LFLAALGLVTNLHMQLQALQVGLTLLAGTTSRTSTRNLRRGLLETFLFDSIIQDFILQVLSIGPTLEVSYKVPTRDERLHDGVVLQE
jgi:hypothetical protein